MITTAHDTCRIKTPAAEAELPLDIWNAYTDLERQEFRDWLASDGSLLTAPDCFDVHWWQQVLLQGGKVLHVWCAYDGA